MIKVLMLLKVDVSDDIDAFQEERLRIADDLDLDLQDACPAAAGDLANFFPATSRQLQLTQAFSCKSAVLT